MAVQIQLRRGTAAQWTSANPTLAAGELGVETDTGKVKAGDGSTAWTSLGYVGATVGSLSLDDLSDVTITAAADGDILRYNGTAWVDAVGATYFAAQSHVGSGGTAHADATTSVAGFMSAADKTKLDGVEAAADVTDATNVAAAGAVMGTLVDAKGDLVVGTADNTVARLAVGTANGQVLVVDSGETAGVKWSGGAATIGVACSDESTAIAMGSAVATFRMPHAMTLTAVRASLTTASSSGVVTVDINEGGSSVLSTKLTIDANEKTSTTADAAAVISDSALADDAEITIDIDGAGTDAAGLKVWLIGTRA